MSPTWARKGSKRWRYYVSQAALQGDKSKAGSILRVPAADVETLVAEALGKLSPDRAASQTDIRNLIDRVVIGRATIRIQLSEVAEENDSARILTLPWTRPSPYRKREIIQGANDAKTYARPMPANARAILIEALRDAHRWLDGSGANCLKRSRSLGFGRMIEMMGLPNMEINSSKGAISTVKLLSSLCALGTRATSSAS